jgi:hypothetical protein
MKVDVKDGLSSVGASIYDSSITGPMNLLRASQISGQQEKATEGDLIFFHHGV